MKNKILISVFVVFATIAMVFAIYTKNSNNKVVSESTSTTQIITTTQPTTVTTTEETETETTIKTTVSTTYKQTTKYVVRNLKEYDYDGTITPEAFKWAGVIYSGGYRYTWYSERVLPGYGLNIPGRYSDGNFVRDENDYICLASSDLPKGTIVETPFGTGKVYDTGCASGTLDVYVSF